MSDEAERVRGNMSIMTEVTDNLRNTIIKITAERDAALEALRPFLEVRGHSPMTAVINKKFDEHSLITVSVTKGQLINARRALSPTTLKPE